MRFLRNYSLVSAKFAFGSKKWVLVSDRPGNFPSWHLDALPRNCAIHSGRGGPFHSLGFSKAAMSTTKLYLLDRNVVSIIKDAISGVQPSDPKKMRMLNKLTEIDTSTSAISCILSLIEGQKGRDESYDEKVACLQKETAAIKSFFRFAATDSNTLQSRKTDFASTFTEYREEDWGVHDAFLLEACPLLRDKAPEAKRDSIKKAIIQSARTKGIYVGHITVVMCLSCLYGSDAARGILKPHKVTDSAFNVLNDVFSLSRISLIKAIAQAQGMVGLGIEFLTLDESLSVFLFGIQVRKASLTSSSLSQTVEYGDSLFPLLSKEQYIDLLHEIC